MVITLAYFTQSQLLRFLVLPRLFSNFESAGSNSSFVHPGTFRIIVKPVCFFFSQFSPYFFSQTLFPCLSLSFFFPFVFSLISLIALRRLWSRNVTSWFSSQLQISIHVRARKHTYCWNSWRYHFFLANLPVKRVNG